MADEYLQEHVTRLLRQGFTGCQFVPRLLRDNRLVLNAFEGIDLGAVDSFSKAAAQDDSVAMALFPSIDTEESFIDWIDDLDAHDSWRLTEQNRKPLRIHVEWRTDEGKWSSCMGFAPFLEMPLPRRLPCVALVLWPGPQTRSAGETVDFKDIATDLSDERQRVLREETTEQVGRLFEIDPETWREVTFGLPQRYRELLPEAPSG